MKFQKTASILLSAALLAGCSAAGSSAASSSSSTPDQGCDAFKACDDGFEVVNTEGMNFKEEYESVNGKVNSSGKEHRTITIPEDNPFEKTDADTIVKMLDADESFYLYIGDSLCPWCRSVLEVAIDSAKEAGVDRIYYLEIWDDEGNEILRDKYELEEGQTVEKQKGSDAYYELLKSFDSVLQDYTLTDDEDNKVSVGEKRIYAPNFFRVENGEVTAFTEGISAKQEDAREALSEDILNDEKSMFTEFFAN